MKRAGKADPKGRAKSVRLGRGRGALWIIALVLAVSAGTRLGSGTGAAIAREVAALAQGADAQNSDGFQQMDANPVYASCDLPEAASLLDSLRTREQLIEQRETEIAVKLKAIEIARTEIAHNLSALETAEKRLASTMSNARTAAEVDLAKLTLVYESMKPKEAALLFEQMAPDFAAGFIARMNPEASAAILAGLAPEAAYSLSVILAGRNANAPKE